MWECFVLRNWGRRWAGHGEIGSLEIGRGEGGNVVSNGRGDFGE